MQERFDAVVLAGYDPEHPDAIALDKGITNKALVPIIGKPMVLYVLEALVASGVVGRIVVTGIEALADAPSGANIQWLPNHPDGVLANVHQAFVALVQEGQDPHVLLTSADVPLLTGEMVAWYLKSCRPYGEDFYVGVVERKVMEAVFPESKRTYAPMVEGELCNGQLYLARMNITLDRYYMMQELIPRRKNVLRLAQLLGLPNILRFVFRRLRVQDVTDLVWKRAQVRAAMIALPFAEAGMDVDKPHQLAQVEEHLRMKGEKVGSG